VLAGILDCSALLPLWGVKICGMSIKSKALSLFQDISEEVCQTRRGKLLQKTSHILLFRKFLVDLIDEVL